jgi:hypothetical protein
MELTESSFNFADSNPHLYAAVWVLYSTILVKLFSLEDFFAHHYQFLSIYGHYHEASAGFAKSYGKMFVTTSARAKED